MGSIDSAEDEPTFRDGTFECPSCCVSRRGSNEQERQNELRRPCHNPVCPSHRPPRSLYDYDRYACEDARSMDSVLGMPEGALDLLRQVEGLLDGKGFGMPAIVLGSVLWRLMNQLPHYRYGADRELSSIVLRDGGRTIETTVLNFPTGRRVR